MISPFRWRALPGSHHSAFLLAAQVLSLAFYALVEARRAGRALLGATGVVILVLVFWVIDRSPALAWVAWMLVVWHGDLRICTWSARFASRAALWE